MTRLALRRVPLFASLAVLIVLPMQVSPQEGASTGGEVARNDRVVAGDRVAVLPLWYHEDIAVGGNLSATVQETIQFLLRFLPNYELVETDTYPSGQSALTEFGARNDLDTVIFGRINRDAGAYTVSLLLYDIASDQIVEVKQDTAESMLDIFDLTDRLSLEILESYIGRPLAFGSLTLLPDGPPPDRYRLYINGILVGENTDRFERFLAGHYTVRIDQVVSEYSAETIFDDAVDVAEGQVTSVSFARVDVGECLVTVDGPDLPITLHNDEMDISVSNGDRVVLSSGRHEFSVSQPDYRGRPYPLSPVAFTVRPERETHLSVSTIALGRGFEIVPRTRGGPDSVPASAVPGGADYTVYLDNSPLTGGTIDVLPVGIHAITVEQTLAGAQYTVLDVSLRNRLDEPTTVRFPLFVSPDQYASYVHNREPDLSVVLQGLDGTYVQVGIRYEAFQRRVGLSALGGFYSYADDIYTTGKGKLHWLPRGGGSRWTPEIGAVGMVDVRPDGPVYSVGPHIGVSWNPRIPVVTSLFVENELRYAVGEDLLLLYFFGAGVRLF